MANEITRFERNHYFYGKLLTVKDFQLEQEYFRNKIHITNQLLQGIGIIDGLEIINLTTDAENTHFTLTKGSAIDSDGHIILVEKDKNWSIAHKSKDEFYIHLEYKECQQDSVPILSNSSQCGDEECCANKIVETYNVVQTDYATQCKYRANCNPISTVSEDEENPLIEEKSNSKIILAKITNYTIAENSNNYRCYINSNQELFNMICEHQNENNPHQIKHDDLPDIEPIDISSNNNNRNKHVSNANAKKWENHVDSSANPHETKHSELKEVKGFGTSNNSTKDKHISNNDAKKWNSYNINGATPDNNGKIVLKAGDNITIEKNGENSITISAETSNQNNSQYKEFNLTFPNKNVQRGDSSMHVISHKFKRFPIVDIYYEKITTPLIVDPIRPITLPIDIPIETTKRSYIKYIGNNPEKEFANLSITIEQIDEETLSISAKRNNEPTKVVLKIILMA